MARTSSFWTAVLLSFLMAAPACTRAPDPHAREVQAPSMSSPVAATETMPAAPSGSPMMSTVANQSLPPAVVHKSPSCGCCALWVDHLRAAGFAVQVHDTDNLNPIKEAVGVPVGKGSCHTTQVGGYFVEGHVPAEDIKRLLAEQPDAKGLVLPGMPMGSPGMEAPDGSTAPYTVELVARDGSTHPFAKHLR